MYRISISLEWAAVFVFSDPFAFWRILKGKSKYGRVCWWKGSAVCKNSQSGIWDSLDLGFNFMCTICSWVSQASYLTTVYFNFLLGKMEIRIVVKGGYLQGLS